MNTVFPVELSILSSEGKVSAEHLFQGFTRDVSAGGMCIELKSFGKPSEKDFFKTNTVLRLTINPPFSSIPIDAQAQIVWIRQQTELLPASIFIGATYLEIDPRARRRIMRYARRLLWVPRAAVTLGLLMLGLIAYLFIHDQKLFQENKKLVNTLIQSAEKKSDTSAQLVAIQNAKRKLAVDLYEAEKKIRSLETKMSSIQEVSVSLRQSYQKEMEDSRSLKKTLSEKLKNIEVREARVETDFKNLERSEKMTASATLRQMYEWLKAHQNLKTGLISSFEGDPSLENVGFTYDQALVCQNFLLFGDTANAAEVLSFYKLKASSEDGVFYNAYATADGSAVESTIHTGPNIWIGISAVQYEYRVRDGQFTGLARQIADWAIRMQDPEGGLKGGPQFTWYSTEHNLDAYAFFGMLYEVTGDKKYLEAQEKVFSWIKKYAYSLVERRMNRGKGDSTIATDTFSWAIAALGPEKLIQNNFDPEGIMEFAESNCKVTVQYKKPNGKLMQVTGFDFSKAQNLGRGGVVSTEWTAQMIVSHQILAQYFKSAGDLSRATFHIDKVNYYLSELQKMLITSPSKIGRGKGCLPYASMDSVETGHGWRTPRGSRTGSVAGTAYGIFAWTGYNPFDLQSKKRVETEQGS